jgi:hypothetical protein
METDTSIPNEVYAALATTFTRAAEHSMRRPFDNTVNYSIENNEHVNMGSQQKNISKLSDVTIKRHWFNSLEGRPNLDSNTYLDDSIYNFIINHNIYGINDIFNHVESKYDENNVKTFIKKNMYHMFKKIQLVSKYYVCERIDKDSKHKLTVCNIVNPDERYMINNGNKYATPTAILIGNTNDMYEKYLVAAQLEMIKQKRYTHKIHTKIQEIMNTIGTGITDLINEIDELFIDINIPYINDIAYNDGKYMIALLELEISNKYTDTHADESNDSKVYPKVYPATTLFDHKKRIYDSVYKQLLSNDQQSQESTTEPDWLTKVYDKMHINTPSKKLDTVYSILSGAMNYNTKTLIQWINTLYYDDTGKAKTDIIFTNMQNFQIDIIQTYASTYPPSLVIPTHSGGGNLTVTPLVNAMTNRMDTNSHNKNKRKKTLRIRHKRTIKFHKYKV